MRQPVTAFAQAMDDAGIKPDELAHESGLSLGYIYKLRRGEQRPSLDKAEILCRILDKPLDIFLSSDCPSDPNDTGAYPEPTALVSAGQR